MNINELKALATAIAQATEAIHRQLSTGFADMKTRFDAQDAELDRQEALLRARLAKLEHRNPPLH